MVIGTIGSLHVSAYALNLCLPWYSLLFDRMPPSAEYCFETSTDRIMAPCTMLITFELCNLENAALNRTEVEAMIRSLSEEWSIEVRYCDDIPASAF